MGLFPWCRKVEPREDRLLALSTHPARAHSPRLRKEFVVQLRVWQVPERDWREYQLQVLWQGLELGEAGREGQYEGPGSYSRAYSGAL